MMNFLKKVLEKEILFQRVMAVFLVLFLAVLIVIQVILRYVFKVPLMGIEELMLFPTIWLYMLGGANASEHRTHIDCGVLNVYLKRPKTIKFFEMVKSVISVIICSWLLYWAYWFFMYSFRLWKTSDLLYIPMFFGESAIFIGLLLMLFFGVYELVDNLKAFFKNPNDAERGEAKC